MLWVDGRPGGGIEGLYTGPVNYYHEPHGAGTLMLIDGTFDALGGEWEDGTLVSPLVLERLGGPQAVDVPERGGVPTPDEEDEKSSESRRRKKKHKKKHKKRKKHKKSRDDKPPVSEVSIATLSTVSLADHVPDADGRGGTTSPDDASPTPPPARTSEDARRPESEEDDRRARAVGAGRRGVEGGRPASPPRDARGDASRDDGRAREGDAPSVEK